MNRPPFALYRAAYSPASSGPRSDNQGNLCHLPPKGQASPREINARIQELIKAAQAD